MVLSTEYIGIEACPGVPDARKAAAYQTPAAQTRLANEAKGLAGIQNDKYTLQEAQLRV